MNIRSSGGLLLCGALIGWAASAADGAIKRQTIRNNTGGNVNDLRLDFDPDKKVAKPKLWHTGAAVDTDNDDINDSGERIAGTVGTGNETDQATWPQNSFGTIANGNTADIDYEHDGKIDVSQSQWTLNGADVGAPVIVGEPMTVAFNVNTSQGSATFRNPGGTTITYTDIQLCVNNDLGNYTGALFDQATGTCNGHADIVLTAGNQFVVPLGAVDLKKYVLVAATVFENSAPAQEYNMITADLCLECIPAVSSWGLVALTLLVLAAGAVVLRRGTAAA